ncbi:hypothetical protein Spiro2_001878 [Spirobacillus cienkowskii]
MGMAGEYLGQGFATINRAVERGIANTWNAYTNYHINRAQGHGIMRGNGGWITENTELNNHNQ